MSKINALQLERKAHCDVKIGTYEGGRRQIKDRTRMVVYGQDKEKNPLPLPPRRVSSKGQELEYQLAGVKQREETSEGRKREVWERKDEENREISYQTLVYRSQSVWQCTSVKVREGGEKNEEERRREGRDQTRASTSSGMGEARCLERKDEDIGERNQRNRRGIQLGEGQELT